MTVLTRGARGRRSGRRPGWLLLTVLLVLAIVASSALVFTDRVELLKLAIILSLWAAVVAAFVSVIYRRQSDADQAKARDLKLVYDLQLDREISARREYELTLESQLRRELASELRAQTADEVATLRAELAALRANLEIFFDTDLGHRPAIETDRAPVHAYSDWARDSETTGRVSSSRIGVDDESDIVDGGDARTEESPIIDVPAEPQPPEDQPVWLEPEPSAGPAEWQPAPADGEWLPAGEPGSNWVPSEPESGDHDAPAEYVGRRRAVEPAMSTPPPESRRGRHSAPTEAGDLGRPSDDSEPPHQPPTLAAPPAAVPPAEEGEPTEEFVPRHRGEADDAEADEADEADEAAEADEADEADEETVPPGQSVADLLARLHAGPAAGGGRRRREE
jgi:hypothetical protein